MFKLHIGIDYSGAETAESRIAGLQVFAAKADEPQKITTPAAPPGAHWKWTRKEVAQWLIDQAKTGERFIAGIDHGFSFPASYMQRYGFHNWDQFLKDFCQHWPTTTPHTYVDMLREGNKRVGDPSEFRLTERWTSSAKSVFAWQGPGVAHSTHAGIPWLYHMRQQVGKDVHFWPYDGWEMPQQKSVIVEVYPAIFKKRYPPEDRNEHEQDAYAVARWMKDMDEGGVLDRFFDAPLNDAEQEAADLEGWIFGIT